ncbi:HDOD domain-containing protein [Variovorax sp. J22P168]|uniref:HDOD domain-containing protein n=1 Tax=Variovorax jilinensis TaxID=3053513 RepID=UPI0025767908|nr:HDOD domain-containing protein [Variovorax sp. J22P168]MDM0014734.1 HDOD domain-containing protein [Variovorax sp. J22P168]
MAQSVLGNLTLGFRPLWGRSRMLAGVRLFVHEDGDGVDGQHLLRVLAELRAAESPELLLSLHSRHLLADMLLHAGAADPVIEVPLEWLGDARVRSGVIGARARGARLVSRGEAPAAAVGDLARCFERRIVSLSAIDAGTALRAGQRARESAAVGRLPPRAEGSPVTPNCIVEGVASRALVEHALDQQGAWAVAGWPAEDALHRYAGQPLPPSRRAIVQAMNALDDEPSLDRIEQLIGEEPSLAYRLLVHLNSAGLGLRSGISSLRHGFMMLGFRSLNAWLAEQLPQATDDADLRPVNATMVLRGHLMEHLMDAGIEDDLRREVYLCGLFAQLDLVQDEPLRVSLGRVPLSERIAAAVMSASGPYAPSLEAALALESEDPRPLRAVRERHGLAAEDVNRALLRTLST